MQLPPTSQPVFSAEDIQTRVRELGARISAEMGGSNLLCLTVLRGGVFFAIDLMRAFDQERFDSIELDFVKLESYGGTKSRGSVKIKGSMPRVAGRNVLVIEDMIDSGRTLESLDDALKIAGAQSVRYAVLVDRTPGHPKCKVHPNYVAFPYEGDLFLYGYGLDIDGKYRTLRSIGGVPRQ